MKIRTQLVVLIVAALLPFVVFGAIMTARFWELQRESYQQQFLERVRALRIALDTDLEATIRALDSLSRSTEADTGGDAFAARIQRMVGAQTAWSTLGLATPEGAVVAHANHPRITQDVGIDRETVDAVVSTKAPRVSNLVALPGGAYLTFVAVPVLRDGAVVGVLYAGVDHNSWLAFLRRYPIAERATLTLNDRNGVIVARTLNDERWVGRPSSPAFVERARGVSESAFRNTSLEGEAFYSAFSRSAVSGWTLGTGVPQEDVEQALMGSTVVTLGGFAIAALAALALAFVFGRRIAGAVTSLAASARSLVESERRPAPLRRTGPDIEEIETVRVALLESGEKLHERQQSLNDAIVREAQARAEAEHASLAKDQFLAMLGHELRNPLSAISNASTLLERARDEGVAARARSMIQRQVQHLIQMVNDLLDVSRVTSGKVVLAKRVVDLAVVVVHAVEALKDMGRFQGLSLDVKVDAAPVLGDETRLEQITTNLVDNACKYTPPGGRIEIRVGAVGDQVELTVSDNGSGIPPELMPHVFDLFVQGERTLDRSQGGLGIGLPVVRRLVDLHGGSVTVHSDGAGTGSRFVVRLPLYTGHHRDAATIVTPALAGRLRIALVEDRADERESLRIVLEEEGHDVAAAVDGPSGLALILDRRPDVALIDIGLPGFDGLELARRVRAAHRAMRLIALTGYGGAEDRALALAAGFDDYMVKPFDLARFRMWLASPARDAA
jgi:signal transduction histidine kinase